MTGIVPRGLIQIGRGSSRECTSEGADQPDPPESTPPGVQLRRQGHPSQGPVPSSLHVERAAEEAGQGPCVGSQRVRRVGRGSASPGTVAMTADMPRCDAQHGQGARMSGRRVPHGSRPGVPQCTSQLEAAQVHAAGRRSRRGVGVTQYL